ncbi:MAG: 50S ribosomal protein L2 [Candidatus Nealsonbacteria bacterium CG10_big_fil_rev_8_21_14_0_10_36_24]|uniref:Large ribosomal subunit protein uL2 n=2 Tax=Candidatus Nealsoniibacteriota TaxID=1817911 RepID=A0A2H0YN04_9BACT|nr:MAG: 50S ribosomal protein L2 [Candidatus Nealsonbacteria bacterium CG10_big_fil_rev_8_21_14_0_10_36_24]PIS39868.1 MAG: 50S ribosomal protein L2 [Candidatus Nealsonbacteria bacterium CG08_land_8_20_14_0_20_36_22]
MKYSLTKKKPEKKLLITLKRRAGRGNLGRITVRHKGGGVKKQYRLIDFGEEKINIPAKVVALEYDPYRTAFIAFLEYEDGDKRYQLAPNNIKVGDKVICAEKAEIKLGNRMKLKNIPVGVMVYNIELVPGKGGKLVRSAGTATKVLAQEGKYTHLEMPSKEIRMVPQDCYATVGAVSHPEWRYEIIGKAGRSRLKGIRPTVRGSAMNPCDHPHGGGEGKTPIGLKYPKTPWGKHALGVKTRKKRWTDKYIIQRRKKKN